MQLFQDKYIVITGAAGMIGSGLVRFCNEAGLKNLILVDDLGMGEKWKNLRGKRFVEIIAPEDLFEWLIGREKDIEAIVHLGACSNTTEKDADYLLDNNTRFSIRLAEYAINAGHRFLYASSAATYGDGSLGFSDAHEELERLMPLNMYGYSKHLFDLWLKDQKVLDKVVGLKYFNVFGPNEYHKGKMASALLRMVPSARKDGVIRLFRSNDPESFADGEQKRDFIYVKDAVNMTAAFLTNGLNGIFNIGTGNPTTWNQLARAVIRALKKEIEITYIDMPDELKGKYQNYTAADMKKGISMGIPTPSFSLEDAVEDYVTNYLLERRYD